MRAYNLIVMPNAKDTPGFTPLQGLIVCVVLPVAVISLVAIIAILSTGKLS